MERLGLASEGLADLCREELTKRSQKKNVGSAVIKTREPQERALGDLTGLKGMIKPLGADAACIGRWRMSRGEPRHRPGGQGKAQRKYPGWRQESSPHTSNGSQGTGQGGAEKSAPGMMMH